LAFAAFLDSVKISSMCDGLDKNGLILPCARYVLLLCFGAALTKTCSMNKELAFNPLTSALLSAFFKSCNINLHDFCGNLHWVPPYLMFFTIALRPTPPLNLWNATACFLAITSFKNFWARLNPIPKNAEKSATARGSDLRVHFKNTVETAHAIRGMGLRRAQRFLKDVIAKKQAIAFHRFNGGVGRKAMVKNIKYGGTQCRFPQKSCKFMLQLLKNAESNAEVKGLNPNALFIEHVLVNAAPKQRRRTYRAHGRINPFLSSPSHIELILTESRKAAKAKDIEAAKTVKKVSKKKQARERMRSGMTAGGD